ncbi:MAG: hypothetical protein GX968_00055 [Tissierellia bacterium]|nr:hypothetical protein [Tissierellia bacterium]
MNNNGFKNGALIGTILGASLGMVFGAKLGPFQKRKIMRNIRRASYSLKDGINSIWE